MREKLPRTLLISAAFGVIPVIGLIPGVIYYRLSLIASLRYYVPRSASMLSRWFARIVTFLMICLQPVPGVGAVTLPLMCLVNYWVYSATLRRQSGRLGTNPVEVMAG